MENLDKLFSGTSLSNELFITHDFGESGIKNLIINAELLEDQTNKHNGIWKIIFKED